MSLHLKQAGADAIFAEAMTEIGMYTQITNSVGIPVLANLTEFGQTPLYHIDELRDAGVRMALYPLSGFRAMSKAALDVFKTIRNAGSQKDAVSQMQTRDELYEVLGYHGYEQKLDRLFEGSRQVVDKKLGGAGLRGQTAGETSLCTVGKTGTGLTYRGYDISDLATNSTFEEVAHLILYGNCRTKSN